MNTTSPTPIPYFLEKGGEMGALIRSHDWTSSPLGDPGTWPYSLRTSISNMLRMGEPMFVLWGKEMICFYNDAALPGMKAKGGKHPAIGQPAPEAWGESWEVVGPLVEQVWKTGEPVTLQAYPISFHHSNQTETTYWDFSYSLIADEEGHAGGILVIYKETTQAITERSQLLDSESKLLSIIAHTPAAIAVFVGPDLIIRHPNQLFIELFDKGAEIEGKSMHSLLSGWVKDDQHFLQLMQEVFRSGKSFEAKEVEVFFKKENETRYFNISFTPLTDHTNTIYAVLDVSLNVTDQVLARKKLEASETHLELLSNTVPAMIFYLDLEQRYRSYNETFQRWFHVDEKEALGKTVREFIGEKAYATVQPHMEIAYAGEQEVYEMSAPDRFQDNRWLSIVYTPHKNELGEVLGVIVHATDVTHSKNTELDLQNKNKELLRVNNDLDNFIYTASHDLKAPIANLEGLLMALQESEGLDEHQLELMELMFTSIERFKTTILDLTEISKAQHLASEKEIVSFQVLLDEILLDIRELTERYHPQLEIEFRVSQISFSRKNLRSILYNLLSNALKYSSPERRAVVCISTEHAASGILLKVSDNGLGLSESNKSKIFGMFQRVHHHVEGSGIGLYMIKKMIENAGGHIELTSKEGAGTTFLIYLPNQEAQYQEAFPS